MATLLKNTSKNARTMVKNIWNMPDATFSKFMDDLADAPMGSKIRAGDRTYTVGGTKSATTLTDDALPGSTMRLSQLSDELTPPVTVTPNGTPRVNMDDFTGNIRTQLGESGQFANPAQLDEAVKSTAQQIANSPAISRLSRLDSSAQVVDQLPVARGASSQNLVRSLTDPIRANPTPAAVRQTLRAVDGQVADGAIGNTIGALANKSSSSSSLSVAEAASAGKQIVNRINAGVSKGRFRQSVFEFVREFQSYIVAGVFTAAVFAGLAEAGVIQTSSSAMRTTPSAMAMAATQTTPDENETRYDAYGLFLLNAALRHQQDQNGCWLYDKLRGTLTKVKVLSCGQVAVDDAMDTCPTQNYAPGLDASIQACPTTLFNPCLKSSTQRTLNNQTPAVPNVCDRYVYNRNNGSAPASVAGVTPVDACAGLDADQTCSSLCKTDQFNLPEYMQLFCVNMDFPTAYADFLSEMGMNPMELFSSAQNTPSPPPPPSRWKMGWVLGGLAVAVMGVAIYGYTRRKRTLAIPQSTS